MERKKDTLTEKQAGTNKQTKLNTDSYAISYKKVKESHKKERQMEGNVLVTDR